MPASGETHFRATYSACNSTDPSKPARHSVSSSTRSEDPLPPKADLIGPDSQAGRFWETYSEALRR